MTFPEAIQTGFRKYADFTGTATRSEFWWWVLFATLASTGVSALANAVLGGNTALNSLWSLAVLLPSLAVTVRRLRDAGENWGQAFWLLLPIAGALIVAVLCTQPSYSARTTPGANPELPAAARS
jgi:uncharacterized membrane protein YhaH (DUF805 family)